MQPNLCFFSIPSLGRCWAKSFLVPVTAMLAAGIRPGYLAWFWGLIHPESQPRIDTGSGPTYFFQLAKFGSMLGQSFLTTAWSQQCWQPESGQFICPDSEPSFIPNLRQVGAPFGSMLGQVIFDDSLVTAVLAAGIRPGYLAVILGHRECHSSRVSAKSGNWVWPNVFLSACRVWADAGPIHFW